MALISIESRIAASGRQVADAVSRTGADMARQTEDQTRRLQAGLATLRTDMLDGFGGVESHLRAMTEDLGRGLITLDLGLQQNRAALQRLGMSLDVVSENLAVGFGQVLSRLERMEGALDRIEARVSNPELTRALERYRTARKLAGAGRPTEALRHIEAAISNDGGLPLTHVPELMAFRAVLRIGQFDTESDSVFDGPGALADFEEAIVFASPGSKRLLQLHLAAARFALQDLHGALTAYADLADGDLSRFARFQMARCHFALSRPDVAADICRALLREDLSSILLFAADPLCQQHPKLFARIADEDRQRRLPAIRAFLSELRTGQTIDSVTTPLRDAFHEALAEPGRVIADRARLIAQIPPARAAADRIAEVTARLTHAKIDVDFHCPETDGKEMDLRFGRALKSAEELNECLEAEARALEDPALELDDDAAWPDIARAVTCAATVLRTQDEALARLERLHASMVDCLTVGYPPQLGNFTIAAKVGISYSRAFIAELERPEPVRKPLLGFLARPLPVDPEATRRTIMQRYGRAESEILDELDGAPQSLGRMLTGCLQHRLKEPLAVVSQHPTELAHSKSRLATLEASLRGLRSDNRLLLEGP